jgi:hypothetical protein
VRTLFEYKNRTPIKFHISLSTKGLMYVLYNFIYYSLVILGPRKVRELGRVDSRQQRAGRFGQLSLQFPTFHAKLEQK